MKMYSKIISADTIICFKCVKSKASKPGNLGCSINVCQPCLNNNTMRIVPNILPYM